MGGSWSWKSRTLRFHKTSNDANVTRTNITLTCMLNWYCFISFHSQQLQDLQEVTQDVHYENYRSERLAKGVVAGNRKTAGPTNSTTPSAAPEQINEKEKILQVRNYFALKQALVTLSFSIDLVKFFSPRKKKPSCVACSRCWHKCKLKCNSSNLNSMKKTRRDSNFLWFIIPREFFFLYVFDCSFSLITLSLSLALIPSDTTS